MFGKKNELQVQVEQLPDVFEDNGLALVEIEDDKVINRIISAVPQLAQAGVNVGAVAEGVQLANQGVYQAILPAGAKLVNSKNMEGAVRGFFRNKKGIAGQANLMNADSAVNKIAAAIGFLMIIVIVALLLKGKMSPIVVLAIVPTISALILGFVPTDILGFIADGIKTTTSNGILFIFSVIYFGVLSDTGLFDVIVNWLVKKAGNNVIAVTVVTAMIATIAHLDGTTAVTVLITIPAMYPVYKRMNIDARILLCITGACMGVMNLLPWGGPTARAATVLQMDATELWHMLIPLQIVGLVMNSVIAVLLGMYAVKKGAGAGKGVEVETNEKEKAETEALKKSRGYLIFNFLLTVAVIAALSTGVGKSYVIFMLGLCVLLAVNYPDQKIQDKLVKKHAPAALIISATLFAAGAMVGIFDGTGMVYPRRCRNQQLYVYLGYGG